MRMITPEGSLFVKKNFFGEPNVRYARRFAPGRSARTDGARGNVVGEVAVGKRLFAVGARRADCDCTPLGALARSYFARGRSGLRLQFLTFAIICFSILMWA